MVSKNQRQSREQKPTRSSTRSLGHGLDATCASCTLPYRWRTSPHSRCVRPHYEQRPRGLFVGTECVGNMNLTDYHKYKIVILIAGAPTKAEHSQLCTWEQWHPRPSNVQTIILAPQPAASTVTCGKFLYYVLSVTLQGNTHVSWD